MFKLELSVLWGPLRKTLSFQGVVEGVWQWQNVYMYSSMVRKLGTVTFFFPLLYTPTSEPYSLKALVAICR